MEPFPVNEKRKDFINAAKWLISLTVFKPRRFSLLQSAIFALKERYGEMCCQPWSYKLLRLSDRQLADAESYAFSNQTFVSAEAVRRRAINHPEHWHRRRRQETTSRRSVRTGPMTQLPVIVSTCGPAHHSAVTQPLSPS